MAQQRSGAASQPVLRRSLAARITALVFVVLVAAGVSAVIMVGQLRELQASFERLTGVYVVFNRGLALADAQAVRVHETIRSHGEDARQDGVEPEPPQRAYLATFEVALNARSELVAEARVPVDSALDNPDRYGGADKLEDLRAIQTSIDRLQALVTRADGADPRETLGDVQTQSQITQLFSTLAKQSGQSIEKLNDAVRKAQKETERLTIGLTLVTTMLGALATIGVFITLRPLRQLSAGVRNLGRGDWAQRVPVPGGRGGDEVSQLATEFNLMAAALEERERRLLRGERLAAAGQLAAQITHEIRNPLSSVALNVELLEDEFDDARPEARHLLAQITKEVDRLTAVTEDYLRFARRPKPELSQTDLREELQSLLGFMAPELESTGVEVDVDFPDGPAPVLGDSGQLRQAFMNLIRNAQEAALDEDRGGADGEPPRIRVRMRCKADRVIVVVSDNGGGIPLPPDELDRIFEAFYTRKARGTGLGLPTVQQILQDHDGSVQVARTGPDGTSFEVAIPACAPAAASVSSGPAATPPD